MGLAITISAQNNGWYEIDGLYGGEVKSVLQTDAGIFCSAGNTIYISTDSGENWAKLLTDYNLDENLHYSDGFLFYNVRTALKRYTFSTGEIEELGNNKSRKSQFLTVDNMILQTLGNALKRSSDYGMSWEFISGYDKDYFGAQLYYAGGNKVILPRHIRTDYYYLSDDLGLTFQQIKVAPEEFYPSHTVLYNNKVYSFDVENNRGIYFSNDGGLSWQPVPTQNQIGEKVTEFLSSDGVFIAVTENNNFFISKNSDMIWEKIPISNPLGSYNEISFKDGNLFITNKEGIFRFNFDSNRWEKKTTGIRNIPLYTLEVYKDMLLLGTESNWLYTYDGYRFDKIILPEYVRKSSKLFVKNESIHLIYETTDYNYSVNKYIISDDGGITWEAPVEPDLQFNLNDIYFGEKYTFYACENALYKKDNLSGELVDILDLLPYPHKLNSHPNNLEGSGETIMVADYNYVYTSYDNGDTWFTNIPQSDKNMLDVARDKYNNYYSIGFNSINVTTDVGQTWQNYQFESVHGHTRNIFAFGDYIYCNNSGYSFKGQIGEYNWQNLTPDREYEIYDMKEFRGELYCGTESNSLVIYTPDSTNILSTYTSYQFGEVILEWNDSGIGDNYRLQVSDDRYFGQPFIDETVTGNKYSINYLESNREYFWRVSSVTQTWDDNFTVTATIFIKSSRDYKIFQNYPNPFNNSTIIRYELPVTSTTNIEVFTVDGSEVKSVSLAKESAGTHKYELDMTGFTSGVYLVRVTAGEFSKILKTVYLK
ncbi:MAG: hypothetical protein SCALA702_04070 [Melioribacteraceae bacterium]|nr:MAG: hypothetical protein SCALA702_04070 [Melioribacteraceae bacterium]